MGVKWPHFTVIICYLCIYMYVIFSHNVRCLELRIIIHLSVAWYYQRCYFSSLTLMLNRKCVLSKKLTFRQLIVNTYMIYCWEPLLSLSEKSYFNFNFLYLQCNRSITRCCDGYFWSYKNNSCECKLKFYVS